MPRKKRNFCENVMNFFLPILKEEEEAPTNSRIIIINCEDFRFRPTWLPMLMIKSFCLKIPNKLVRETIFYCSLFLSLKHSSEFAF